MRNNLPGIKRICFALANQSLVTLSEGRHIASGLWNNIPISRLASAESKTEQEKGVSITKTVIKAEVNNIAPSLLMLEITFGNYRIAYQEVNGDWFLLGKDERPLPLISTSSSNDRDPSGKKIRSLIITHEDRTPPLPIVFVDL